MRCKNPKSTARAQLGELTLVEYYQDSDYQDKVKCVNLLYRLDQSIAHRRSFVITVLSIPTMKRELNMFNSRDIEIRNGNGETVPIRDVCELIRVAYPEPKYKIAYTVESKHNILTVQTFVVTITKKGRW